MAQSETRRNSNCHKFRLQKARLFVLLVHRWQVEIMFHLVVQPISMNKLVSRLTKHLHTAIGSGRKHKLFLVSPSSRRACLFTTFAINMMENQFHPRKRHAGVFRFNYGREGNGKERRKRSSVDESAPRGVVSLIEISRGPILEASEPA